MKAQVQDIEWISDKIRELKALLEQVRAINLAAWRMYGSELCTGEMIAQENQIIRDLKELHAAIGLEYLTPIESLRRKTEEAKALLKQKRTQSKNGNNTRNNSVLSK